jgi:hypothetical protein
MLWVRPGVLDAKARRFCCVSVLMQVDLPALERPTKAISGTDRGGRNSSLGAVVRNLAVCIQPMAVVAAGVDVGVAAGVLTGVLTGECPAGLVIGWPGIAGKPEASL